VLFILAVLIASCTSTPASGSDSQVLKVTATTSIVADIVRQVGGDFVQVTTLVPIGTDEHQYQPTPQDVANVSHASIVFESGLGLEQFMDKLVQNAGGSAHVVVVSDGITPLQFTGDIKLPDEPIPSSGGDPHVWVDPENVKVWVQNIEKALSEADPQHASQYALNAQQTTDSLTSLDEWIKTQVAVIPPSSRKIVTDHLILAILPAVTVLTRWEPSSPLTAPQRNPQLKTWLRWRMPSAACMSQPSSWGRISAQPWQSGWQRIPG